MKIGIINFHWGTNYGAILQAYALQTYLEKIGHEIVIINYKPLKYDLSIFKIFTSRSLFSLFDSLKNLKKENVLNEFRLNHLYLTRRYRSIKELKEDPPQCDVYISGSDQVLNPSFTLFGEGRRSPASTYFLDFGDAEVKRFGYAVSFGCTAYPEKAKKLAQPLLKNFDMISVRENTGIDILKNMGYLNSCVVPDPTLLLVKEDYDKLISKAPTQSNGCYIYMLRNRTATVNKIKHIFHNTVIADTKNEYSMSSWISNIKNGECVITNSFHCVVFCLHYHVPFIILTESKLLEGGNDRFFTLLGPMGLTKRILEESETQKIKNLIKEEIKWDLVDLEINKIRKNGILFLNKILSSSDMDEQENQKSKVV